MGGGSQPSTTKSTTEPWAEQKPYLQHGFSEAERLYGEGPSQYYPGQTYVDQSNATQAGQQQQINLASGSNPLIDSAAGYGSAALSGDESNPFSSINSTGGQGMAATARGDFLTNNPYLDQVYDAASGKVRRDFEDTTIPALNASLGMGGNAGSTMHELALGKASEGLTDSLGSLAANLYGGNYQQERDRQTGAQSGLFNTGVQERLSAMGMAPGIREAQFGNANKLQEVGKAQEGFGEKVLQDDINRFNYGQNSDMAALQDYLSMISGNFGSTSTSRSTQAGGSPLMSGLGAFATMASMFD